MGFFSKLSSRNGSPFANAALLLRQHPKQTAFFGVATASTLAAVYAIHNHESSPADASLPSPRHSSKLINFLPQNQFVRRTPSRPQLATRNSQRPPSCRIPDCYLAQGLSNGSLRRESLSSKILNAVLLARAIEEPPPIHRDEAQEQEQKTKEKNCLQEQYCASKSLVNATACGEIHTSAPEDHKSLEESNDAAVNETFSATATSETRSLGDEELLLLSQEHEYHELSNENPIEQQGPIAAGHTIAIQSSRPSTISLTESEDNINLILGQQLVDRRLVQLIESISHRAYKALLLRYLAPDSDIEYECCKITGLSRGSFHHVVFLAIDAQHPYRGEYCIKVPFIGVPGRWRAGDAHMMRCEAELMNYVGRNTQIPVPQVLACSATTDNELGAPYTIMTKLPGRPAYKIWDGPDEIPQGDDVTESTEQKRIHFLHSLAHIISQLQSLEFEKVGIPCWNGGSLYEAPEMTSKFIWQGTDFAPDVVNTDGVLFEQHPCDTIKQFFMGRFLDQLEHVIFQGNRERTSQALRVSGAALLMTSILDCSPFKQSKKDCLDAEEPDRFVISHNDLDLQNILTDSDGNITGILDWDGAAVVPRSVGYASLPLFLRKDWLPNFSLDMHPYCSWNLDRYRQVYAQAMRATGSPDARYTLKSGIYHATTAATIGGGSCMIDLCQKVLRKIPELDNCDLGLILEHLGAKKSQPLFHFLMAKINLIVEPDFIDQGFVPLAQQEPTPDSGYNSRSPPGWTGEEEPMELTS